MPPKRKQQSTKKPANQKGKKTRKEAEKEVAKELATVAPEVEAPNESRKEVEAVVEKESPTMAPEPEAEAVLEKELVTVVEAAKELAGFATVQPEEDVAEESSVPDEAKKVGAKVLPEVSQEVPKDLAGSAGSEQEGSVKGEMEGEYLVPAAKGGDHEEEDSEEYLTHSDIVKIHCVLEHGKASDTLLAIEDVSEAWMDLKKVPHLILGETKEEKDRDRALLAGLSQLQREEELDRRDQQIKAQEEFRNVDVFLAERKKRLDKLALEKRKREEAEEKKAQKVRFLLLVKLIFLVRHRL
jgi:hypothetical protein